MHSNRLSDRFNPLEDVGMKRRLPPSFSVRQDDGFNSGFMVDRMEAPPASATGRERVTGRTRFVTRSPVQEFESRHGKLRKISNALEIALMGGVSKVKVTRNGVSFVPKLMNAEGSVKRLTWWSAESVICQPDFFGREVVAIYDPFDCSMIHVLDETGGYLDTLPLKDKTPWFDAEATQKAIAETRRIAGRVNSQLQALHVEDSEAAAEAAESNKATLERIVNTFPVNGKEKAVSRSSEGERAMSMAHAEAKHQREKYTAHEAEIKQRIEAEGEEAARLLTDKPDATEFESTNDEKSGDSEAIELIL